MTAKDAPDIRTGDPDGLAGEMITAEVLAEVNRSLKASEAEIQKRINQSRKFKAIFPETPRNLKITIL